MSDELLPTPPTGELAPIDEVPNASSLQNAKILGINSEGGTRLFKISDIKGDGKGNATSETNPDIPVLAQYYWGKPGVTYPYFLDGTGTPISIPAPASGRAILDSKMTWSGAFWELSFEDVPLPEPNNKISPWVDGPYSAGDQVSFNGKDWEASVNIVSGEVPEISNKWIPRLTGNDLLIIATKTTDNPVFDKQNRYYKPLDFGAFSKFGKIEENAYNISFSRVDGVPYLPSDITSISIENMDTGEMIPISMVHDSYYDLAGTPSPLPNYSRSASWLPLNFMKYKVVIVSIYNDWQADVKFYRDAGFQSRTTFLPINQELTIANSNSIVLSKNEQDVYIYGNTYSGFQKVLVDEKELTLNKINELIYPSPSQYPTTQALVEYVKPIMPKRSIELNPAFSGQPTKLAINFNRIGNKPFLSSDIASLYVKNNMGEVTNIPFTKDSFWDLSGNIQPFIDWARSTDLTSISSSTYSVHLTLSPGVVYDDFEFDLSYRTDLGGIFFRTERKAPFGIDIAVPSFRFHDIESLFAKEAPGNKKIMVKGNIFTLNPEWKLKEGWILQGAGMGCTSIKMETDVPGKSSAVAGLFSEGNCEINDLTLITVNNNIGDNDYTTYAMHVDYPGTFTTKFTRIKFVSELKFPDPPYPEINNTATLVGIGTHDNQNIEFDSCILISQSIVYGQKSILNSHNKGGSAEEVVPGRVTFKGCAFIGGFCAAVVADINTFDGTNPNRTKSVWEFISCDIDNIKFNSFGGANGFIFNTAGSNIGELITPGNIVNTALSSYDAASLPVTGEIKFAKNTGSTNILAGDLVSFVYEQRVAHWWAGEPEIMTEVSIEKTTAENRKNFAGVALVDVAAGNFVHIRVKGRVFLNANAGVLNDYLYMSDNGDLSAIVNGVPIAKVTSKNIVNDKCSIELF